MNLEDVGISSVLPDFMKAQEDDVAMANALSEVLRKRALRCSQIGIWDSVQTMDDALLDYVADAFHIQWWKRDWDVATKREMLGQSERIRAGINTKAVLEFLLRKWFGDDTLIVEEWFDYGGQPYTYRIVTSSAEVQSLLRFSRIMETVARRSQMMDGIFVGFSMRGSLHIGAKGSESRTDYGTCVQYPYMPKGTRFTHPDALEELLWESGGTGTDMARDLIADATDAGGVLKRDFPLIYSGDDTDEVLGVSSDNRSMWNRAYTSQWNAVGADIDIPAMSLVWPPIGGGGLSEGCVAFYGFPIDELSDAPSFESAVDGHVAKVYRGSTDITSQIAKASGIVGSGIQQPAGGAWRTVFLQAYQMTSQSDELTVSCWMRTGRQKTEFFRIRSDNTQFSLISWYYENLQVNGTGVSAQNIPAGTHFVANSWNHVAYVYRAGQGVTLYVNGVNIGEASGAYQKVPAGAIVEVELGVSSGTHYADEIGVWNRALSADEVSTLYHNGLDGVTYPFSGTALSGT